MGPWVMKEVCLLSLRRMSARYVLLVFPCGPLLKGLPQDLASVTFPVSFNEPITLLQNGAEQLEYYDLLRQAAETNDAVERMCYVAAFVVSSYAHTRYRSGRKSLSVLFTNPRWFMLLIHLVLFKSVS